VIIRIRATGALLYVDGLPPRGDGDPFRAATTPPAPVPLAEPERASGCVLGVTADGARFFSCRRGKPDPKRGPIREVKHYRFSPRLHEVVGPQPSP